MGENIILTNEQFSSATIEQLKEICRCNKVGGYSGLKKEGIIQLLIQSEKTIYASSGLLLGKRQRDKDGETKNQQKKQRLNGSCYICRCSTTCILPACWSPHILGQSKEIPAMCSVCLREWMNSGSTITSKTTGKRFIFANSTGLRKKFRGTLPDDSHRKDGGRLLGVVCLFFPEEKCFCCDEPVTI